MQAAPGGGVEFKLKLYDFGVLNVIRCMHQDSDFREAVQAAFPPQQHHQEDLFSSSYFQSIDELTGHVWSNRLDSLGAGMYSVGVDGGQLFKIKQHGTWVIGIRRLDVGPHWRGKACTWAPIMIIEGPKKPTDLQSILEPMVNAFLLHSPMGQNGASPLEFHIIVEDKSTKVSHWPLLACAEGDMEAMELLMCVCGHAAFNACPRCCIQGFSVNNVTR